MSDSLNIKVNEVSMPAHRCPRCGTIYPDDEDRALLVCYCGETDAGVTTETIPVGVTVRYPE